MPLISRQPHLVHNLGSEVVEPVLAEADKGRPIPRELVKQIVEACFVAAELAAS